MYLCNNEKPNGGITMAQNIISVGIDIGTSTTQLVFSKLTLKNTAGDFLVPKVEITQKEIIYRSPIYFTPIQENNWIDAEAIIKIIERAYLEAGLQKDEVETGALIITGETVRKENAQAVADALSEFAGEFVTATAGADYEAVLAGHGAGSQLLSTQTKDIIVNFDIGGGTTNAAVFQYGSLLDAYALDIGGRLIRINQELEITYISDRIRPLINAFELELVVGQMVEENQMRKLLDVLADVFLMIIGRMPLSKVAKALFIVHGQKDLLVETITFSGGVAEYIYGSHKLTFIEALLLHGDIGPLLGEAIAHKMNTAHIKLQIPMEKMRATVIGAGNHSMHISGSTVFYDEQLLPLKNCPIVKILQSDLERVSLVQEMFSRYIDTPVVLAFEGSSHSSYEEIKQLAEAIVQVFESVSSGPIIICVTQDFAKALGQTVKRLVKNNRGVISLDQLSVANGEFMDIGKPVAGVVPVVVKTLIFT
jgi:ethanolamine utilization protein EutA